MDRCVLAACVREEEDVCCLPFGRKSQHVSQLGKIFSQTVDKLSAKAVGILSNTVVTYYCYPALVHRRLQVANELIKRL